MNNHECKRCLLHESAQADVAESIKAAIARIPENDKCTTAEYNSRLEFCKSCDELISGVCMKCGCYVELRASFKKQKCPNVSDRKW